ncbi:MAG TPA: hypothetical protein VLF89_08660 [Candidatus Saccharimonadales bacterium]|nr:hypothetical protein [Candidatus Saccharimonadales bacterium]
MKELLTSSKFISISLAVVALIILPLTLIELRNTQTFQQSAATNCPSGYNGDSNAIIWCGANSNGSAQPSRITYTYNHGDGHNSAKSIQNIYGSGFFGITSSEIQNLGSTAKVGSVTKSGDVIVGGKVVATNAVTAGRLNISGSTKRTSNGTVFYTRPPKVSFLSNSLSAYVVMVNGKFKFAILISCGNPVIGTPKAPAPTPTPTKKPTPTPTNKPGLTPTPTKKPLPTPTKAPTIAPTKKPSPTPTTPPGQPTPTICPTLGPVKNVKITCPNCQLSPSPDQ